MAMLSRRPMSVSARATTAPPKSITKSIKVAKKSPSPPPADKTALSVLAKIEQLRLLSQVEKLGLLSKLEAAGFTLSKIEESGLLSFAEKSGLLSAVADKNTPGLLNGLGFALLAAAAGLIIAVPDDSTVAVVAQAVSAITLGAAGFAALTGASTLASFQKL